MAKMKADGVDELISLLVKLENVEELEESILKPASKIMLKSLQNELISHRYSGDLYDSLKTRYVNLKASKRGYAYVEVYPYGRDNQKKPQRNAEKLFILEYGKKNQPPRPVVERALHGVEGRIEELLKRGLGNFVDK